MKTSLLYTFLALFIYCNVAHAQVDDSLKMTRGTRKAIYSTARKAMIMSACLPGLGQAYNKSYWKIPVIYVALGGLSYWGINSHKQYKYYSNNLRYENDGDSTTINVSNYSTDQLIIQKKDFRKSRDNAIMIGILVYLINVIDANVDAHLKTFDVSDDLSLQIKPYTNFSYNYKLQSGITLKLNFK